MNEFLWKLRIFKSSKNKKLINLNFFLICDLKKELSAHGLSVFPIGADEKCWQEKQ
jgi:hypothetical protein